MRAATLAIFIRPFHIPQELVGGKSAPDISPVSLALLGATVGVKLVLWFFCRQVQSSSAHALATDHKNDVFSNALTLGFVVLAAKQWAPADQLGAIIIALIIITNWVQEGMAHVHALTGRAASPHFIQRIVFAALHHSPLIAEIDTVRKNSKSHGLIVFIQLE